ncbi:MAG: hypothetical protein M3065_01140 [Actinomycetota bacterium]|nr:hypothetical protein [Actinomycetota bacterium]
MSDSRPRDMFESSFRRGIRTRLRSGPVLLVAPVGAGADDLARADAERGKTAALLDPTGGSTLADVTASTVAQLVDRIEPAGNGAFDGDSPHARRARLELARRYGSNATRALEIARGASPVGWTLANALGAKSVSESRAPVLVAIINAHRLPDPLLWELRDLANIGHAVVLATTHREHVARLSGPAAPLYGNVSVLELPRLNVRDWARALAEPVHPSDLEWLLARTRARAASTLEVLAFREPERSIRSAWSRAVNARRPEAESVLNLAGAMHTYAPRLLVAIANGAPPYGAIAGAPSQRVARALAKLRDMDLIEQEVPRVWQIADPVLSGALLSRTRVLFTRGQPDPWSGVSQGVDWVA